MTPRRNYREQVRDQVLQTLPELTAGQAVGQCVGTRGTNCIDVRLPSQSADAPPLLCRVPSKFSKLVWIRRGTYVVIEEDDRTVVHVLYAPQIEHLRSIGQWPKAFETLTMPPPAAEEASGGSAAADGGGAEAPDGAAEPQQFGGNRRVFMINDASSSSSEDADDGPSAARAASDDR